MPPFLNAKQNSQLINYVFKGWYYISRRHVSTDPLKYRFYFNWPCKTFSIIKQKWASLSFIPIASLFITIKPHISNKKTGGFLFWVYSYRSMCVIDVWYVAQCFNGNNVTLTGETAEATCHCGKVCKNIRGLRIHQLRTQCGQAGTQIQRTIVTTVGETAENFNQYQHHSIEALSETDTMHASTMKSDNHTRSSNRDESPDPLI